MILYLFAEIKCHNCYYSVCNIIHTMLPNYQARSPFVLKHTTSWRASVASETVLGVDNAKSGICYMYLYHGCCGNTHGLKVIFSR